MKKNLEDLGLHYLKEIFNDEDVIVYTKMTPFVFISLEYKRMKNNHLQLV